MSSLVEILLNPTRYGAAMFFRSLLLFLPVLIWCAIKALIARRTFRKSNEQSQTDELQNKEAIARASQQWKEDARRIDELRKKT